ncbi:MAG: hypothetical protein J2P25_18675 [Nocardiopsaceae bacterium]|nr:hypothetical protein [Nocardiopsaceae bacterium]
MTATEGVVLERRISAERLAPYRQAVRGDVARALDLYQWNAQAGAAFWVVLGHLEILLRNAMHDQLTVLSRSRHGSPIWYLGLSGLFSSEACRAIADARRQATSSGRPETPGRVIAEIPIGFWRYLLASRYERTLWRTCLYRSFPGQGRRRAVHDKLARIHRLRNRIAHHEPIHNRPLESLHDDILLVAGWICPVTRTWIDRQSTVRQVLSQRPRP